MRKSLTSLLNWIVDYPHYVQIDDTFGNRNTGSHLSALDFGADTVVTNSRTQDAISEQFVVGATATAREGANRPHADGPGASAGVPPL